MHFVWAGGHSTRLVGPLARDLLGRCRGLTRSIGGLDNDLHDRVSEIAPTLLPETPSALGGVTMAVPAVIPSAIRSRLFGSALLAIEARFYGLAQ